MRKLAPVFVTTSILALAMGNAMAMADSKKEKNLPATSSTTAVNGDSKTMNQESKPGNAAANAAVVTTPPAASPTVSANTQSSNNLSYSDKSNVAPGTNAVMDDKTKTSGSMGKSTAGGALTNPNTTGSLNSALAEDRPAATSKLDKPAGTAAHDGTTVKKAKKKTLAKNDKLSHNPPTEATSPAAAGSTTGRSLGGDGSASGSAGASGSSSSGSASK